MEKITLKTIIANGGATLNYKGEAVNYKTGYQVSCKDLYTCPVNKLRMSGIKTILAGLRSYEHLGIWIDKGIAYVDISERIGNRTLALELGREREQRSVWAWAKNMAVTC